MGLLAEEYDPTSRRQLGNFPQAFSHVALVNSALTLAGSGVASAHGYGDREAPSLQRPTYAGERAEG